MFNNNFNAMDLDMDFEFTSDLSSVAMPRWKRKQMNTHSNDNNAKNNQEFDAHYANYNDKVKNTQGSNSCLGDRFIPNRNHMDMDIAQYKLYSKENCENFCDEDNQNAYQNTLEQRIFDGQKLSQCKVLALSEKAPSAPKSYQNNLRVMFSTNKVGGGLAASMNRTTHHRQIPTIPERVLDGPSLVDDFYLNLLDWSSQNILAVALGSQIYLWNGQNGSITKLVDTCSPDNYITSISWIADGSYLGVGTNYNSVMIFDVEQSKHVRTMDGHSARVSSMSWNNHILSSGSRDKSIIHHDVRVRDHKIATLVGHEQEVCGLKWNHEGTQLASGGNDNILNVWDAAATTGDRPKFSMTSHCAAVKALAWCPWQQNLLASGGGTADRKLMFWNTNTGSLLNSIDTKSQVCSIMFSKHDRELVSSHGFSQNQLIVWKYPSLVKIAELTGHTSRVLHLAQSPDGATVVSAAADETLRFWKIFSSSESKSGQESKYQSQLAFKSMNIR